MKKSKMSAKTLVIGALLTALVILLQYLGSFVRFGPFSISLVLIPVVIGAITCGKGMGAYLGTVFGATVLTTGDANLFLVVNAPGTIITVLLKGALCGFLSALVYQAVLKVFNKKYPAAVVAAIVCPVVNTGIFLIGCLLFFMETVSGWAAAAGFSGNVGGYMLVGLVGVNFLVELAFNIIFAPALVQIMRAVKLK